MITKIGDQFIQSTHFQTDGSKTIRLQNETITTWRDGSVICYTNGKRHRIDGPAVIYANGDRVWYREGVRHRDDGPAVECADGRKFWFINGNELSFEEHRAEKSN